jgi:hypothetical protein
MNNFDILKNNFLFRLLVGLNSIIIGLFLLIPYLQRNKKIHGDKFIYPYMNN